MPAGFVALTLQTRVAVVLPPLGIAPRILISMNALESLPASVLNFVIFAMTIFGRLVPIVRSIY